MRYLAIDYGAKRTGLAVCDVAETIASPYAVLHGQKDLVQQIGRVVASENIEAIVLGKGKRLERLDALAAAEILQAFLEQKARS
jgi:putative Holliday junction resolvase